MTLRRWHQGCSAAWHDYLLDDPIAWAVETHSEEYVHIHGTDQCVARAVCHGCGRSMIRGRVKLAEVVIPNRAPTIRRAPTLRGMPAPIEPGVAR